MGRYVVQGGFMKLIGTSIFVDDQDKALKFYTEILGFEVKHNIPVGEFKWLSLTASKGSKEFELILEPNHHPAALTYQTQLYHDGIPANMFGVDDIEATVSELKEKGVKIVSGPTNFEGSKVAVFDDTCGNLIQLLQTLN